MISTGLSKSIQYLQRIYEKVRFDVSKTENNRIKN